KVFKQKYLSHPIFSKNLYKEIRKYKPSVQANEGDASRLYEELLAKQQQDPRKLYHGVNLVNRLGTTIQQKQTVTWVLHMTKKATRGQISGVIITDTDPAMEHAIMIKYPTIVDTRIYVDIVHIGIETTSFVESENAYIKANEKQYEDLINFPSTTNYVTIFPTIEVAIIHYLHPRVAQNIINQMKECVYYMACCSNIEKIENAFKNKLSKSESLEDEPDSVLACVQFLLFQLHYDNIAEI
ncbi:16710_t:CDS:2, partial [Racocetra persica]